MKCTALAVGLLLSAAAASAQAPALESGESALVAPGTSLRSRPTTDSPQTEPLADGSSCTLIARSVNQTGPWWYVDAGGRKGWVQEDQLSSTAGAAATTLPPLPPTPPPEAQPLAATPPVAPAPALTAKRGASNSTPADPTAIQPGDDEIEFAATVNRGTQETRGFGTTIAEVDYTRVFASLAYGHFLTQHHELGLVGSVSWIDFEGGGFSDKVSEWAFGPRYTLNFPDKRSTIVPFISAEAQWITGDSDGQAYEGSAGFRALATRSISLNWRAYYRAFEVTDTANSFQFEDQGAEYGLRVGFSWLVH